MINDFKPAGSDKAGDEKQKSLDIYNNDDNLKSAAVQRPLVDTDKMEEMMGTPESYDILDDDEHRKASNQPRHLAWWAERTKKQRMLLIAGSLVFLAIVSGGTAYMIAHKNKPKANADAVSVLKVDKKATQQPTTVASQLSGLQVDPSLNNRPVVGVMIENSTDARPQSGLDQAGVVFEAIAEGGITRFLALFQDTQPSYVGPVRSVRPYYQMWALGFDAPMAHVGGSPEAIANIKNWKVKDLDQFYNSGAYHRVSSRAAPHNVYTSLANLTNLSNQKGYAKSTFTSFARKTAQIYKPAPAGNPQPDTRTPANSINLNISSALFNVSYAFDQSTNTYKRTLAGQPHMVVDESGNKKQITPSVVVALVMPYSIQADGKHSVYGTIGSGQAFIFQDGTVTTGTWTKASNTEQFKFTDATGKTIGLNPGQTWITAVKAASNVTYQ